MTEKYADIINGEEGSVETTQKTKNLFLSFCGSFCFFIRLIFNSYSNGQKRLWQFNCLGTFYKPSFVFYPAATITVRIIGGSNNSVATINSKKEVKEESMENAQKIIKGSVETVHFLLLLSIDNFSTLVCFLSYFYSNCKMGIWQLLR